MGSLSRTFRLSEVGRLLESMGVLRVFQPPSCVRIDEPTTAEASPPPRSGAVSDGAPPSSPKKLVIPQATCPLGVAVSVSPSSLPSPLKERVQALAERPPTALLYPDLGRDLFGVPNPDRRAFLQALLGALALPKGSIFFWPPRFDALAGPPTAESLTALYSLVKPRSVLAFGVDSTLFRELPGDSIPVLALPDFGVNPQDFLLRTPVLKQRILAFLSPLSDF